MILVCEYIDELENSGGNSKNALPSRIIDTIIINHAAHCSSPTCPVFILRNKKPNEEKQSEISLALFLTIRYLKEILAIHPEASFVRLYLISLLLYNSKNLLFAWELSLAAQQYPLSDLENCILFCQKLTLKKIFKKCQSVSYTGFSSVSTGVDYISGVIMSQEERKFLAILEKLTQQYINVWIILQDGRPSQDRFLEALNQLMEKERVLNKKWQSMLEIKARNDYMFLSLQGLQFYAKFLESVAQDQYASKEVISIMTSQSRAVVSQKFDIKALGDCSSEGDAILAVSAEAKRFEEITACSASFSALSGYSEQELKNKKVSFLLLPEIQELHSKAVLNECHYCESGGDRITRREYMKTYLVTKSKFIIPVVVRVLSIPSFINDYNFIALIKYNKMENAHNVIHFIANKELEITAFTSSKINFAQAIFFKDSFIF